MAKATAEAPAPAPQTGRIVSRTVQYGQVPIEGQFRAYNRTYKKIDSHKHGGFAECMTDQAFDQYFFDLATVTVDEFVPNA